jgi:hypothetical protein
MKRGLLNPSCRVNSRLCATLVDVPLLRIVAMISRGSRTIVSEDGLR